MKNFVTLILVIVLLIPYSTFAEESNKETVPEPNWYILNTKPFKSTKNGNVEIDSFKLQNERTKKLDYAWACCLTIGDTCRVIIWIRGTDEDIRITYKGKKENNLCAVYVSSSDYEKYFKCSVLAGISAYNGEEYIASFEGDPEGDREKYWFEWTSNVRPTFY
ncbi:microbial collagenase [Candidatus Scalindua japonica]|uniref:Microbial collagenase n=1 Tax=Candidatus Scalindua japonica TaxID=1284222 RepID=A0A286TXF2_9BACT|nr:hypothetical protein [Candidatus Scalindua japonica]GAX60556.1 microbial collagenase [Candidatus Scalindua japonica]